jgi:two-component system cell cycle sensor histidine kinase/response regulator CckA
VKKSNLLALRAITVYCVVTGAWILLSNQFVGRFVTDPRWLGYFHTYICKGLAFLAGSAIVFFFLLRCQLQRWEAEVVRRKEAETALSADEEKLRAIFEAEPDCLKLLDADAILREINPAGLEIMEADDLASVLGKSVIHVVEPEYREAVRAMLVGAANGEKRNLEFKITGLKGTPRWIDMYVAPVRDPVTGKNRVLAVSQDITDRKRAETEVARLARQNEMILNTAGEGIWGLDTTGKATFINVAGARMLGYEPQELIGRYTHATLHHTTIHGQPHPIEQCPIQMALRDGQAHRCSNDIFWRKDGTSFPVQYACSPMVENGKVVGEVVVFSDMTECKQAEDELHWKTAFLEAQVDSALDGIIVVDNQGKIILQNQRAIEIWQVPAELVANREDAWQTKFAADQTKNPQQFLDKVASLYAHPDEVSRDEIELINGTFLERYSYPVRDKAGKHYGRIWTFRDITERRKLECQYRQSQKLEAIGLLASGVAHDFNNILTVIQLQAGLLKAEQSPNSRQKDFAVEIENASQRAANLTRQLLLFSRQQIMQLRDLDLNEVIAHITKMLLRVLGEHIQMQFKYSPQPIYVHADAGMMDQVLLNLAVNARDAMPKGGQLVIETSVAEFDEASTTQTPPGRPGQFACLSVQDTGHGIALDIMPRIFEPFFTTKEVGKGTGLGLATVFGIVQQHQGWIDVQSAVGTGTTFRVYLPLLNRPPDNKKADWSSLASVRGGDETILLVEDDPILRTSVRTTLSLLGYQVLEAGTGMEAIKIWKAHQAKICLLLTDLVVPGGMTGRDLAELLLQHDPELKVVYMSGYSPEIASGDFVLEEGVNFLVKPFETQKLTQTIRQSLDGLHSLIPDIEKI